MNSNLKLPIIFWLSLGVSLLILTIIIFNEIELVGTIFFVSGIPFLFLFVIIFMYSLLYAIFKRKTDGIMSFIPLLIQVVTVLLVLGTVGVRGHYNELDQEKCNSTPSGYSVNNDYVEYVMRYYWFDNCGPIGCGEPECQKRSYTLANVDLDTFEIINQNYAKDKNNVYHKFLPMNDADPETFEVGLDEFTEIEKEECNSTPSEYSINKDNVEYVLYYWRNSCKSYYCGEEHCVKSSYELTDVDMETFEVISDNYAKDKNNIFNGYKEMENADPKTFEVINRSYSKDQNHIYFGGRLIEGLVFSEFEIIYGAYAKDKNNVYFQDHVIEGVDPTTFDIIEGAYSKDKNNVYLSGKVLEEADPETFAL